MTIKRALMIASVFAAFFGCKKSQNTPVPSLSGRWALYKTTDTAYNQNIISDGVANTTIQNASGDTLTFTSATTGVENISGESGGVPFTYSLKTGALITSRPTPTGGFWLVQVDATDLEMRILENSGNLRVLTEANYYKKLN